MPTKLVIFDADGVLFDTEEFIVEVARKIIGPYGFKVEKQTLLKAFGLPLPDFYVFGIPGVTREIAEKALKNNYNYFLRHLDKSAKVFPTTKPVLEKLNKLDLKIALHSSDPDGNLQKRVEYAGLSKYFDYVIGAGVLPRSKPHPDPFLHICDQFKILPKDTLAVGDMRNDLLAAKAAGCVSVVLAPKGKRRQFDGLEPDFYIEKLDQLLDLV